MYKTIYFATSNTIKFRFMKQMIDSESFQLEQKVLPLIETQADSVIEVARSKAQQAFDHLQQPVIVEDTGFRIPQLGGFPGVYLKYVMSTIGTEGILNLTSQLDDRSCSFHSAVVYVDENGDTFEFESADYSGNIASEADTATYDQEVLDIWRVFILDDTTQPLSAIPPEERDLIWKKLSKKSAFWEFSKWLHNLENHSE